VRQHGLAGDVADGKHRRLGCAALRVRLNEPSLIDLHRGLFESGNFRVRPPADGDKDAIEQLLTGRIALESDLDAAPSVCHLYDLRIHHDPGEQLVEALLQHVHQIAIGARQQAAGHLDNGHFAAERGVDGAELETDVAAADDEQRLRNVRQVETAGRIHHARAVE
jgi:hypothetical protein